MTNLKILIFFLILSACNSNNSNNLNEIKCIEPYLRPIYFEQGCNGEICGYNHTLMLDNYTEDCFNDYDFIYITDKYLDSVKTNLPVRSITFVKPFDFQPDYDSRDSGPIREHSIVDIYYSDETMKNKVPEITSISIWENGVRKTLDYMNNTYRQKRMEYYNSKKK